MRHHAQNVPDGVENSCDIPNRTVWNLPVLRIGDAIFVLQLFQRIGIREVISIAMPDRHAQELASLELIRERRIPGFCSQAEKFADVFARYIPQQCTWQQSAFGKNL